MKERIIYIILLLLGSQILIAQPLVLIPKWTAQAQFAGYYAAEDLGFYKDEGLDLHIRHVTIGESSFSCLQSGRAQVVVMNLSYALMARRDGVKLVNIAQTSQRNSLMLVSHTPIPDPASLRQQKIAVWNHLGNELLDLLDRRYGLDAEWIHFNSGVNLFLSGAVNICLVGSYNEYPQLAEFGKHIDSTCVFRLSENGYDLPEDGLYVKEEFALEHPELVQKIARASMRGWKWVNEHREEALDIVMKRVKEDNIGTNRYHQRIMLEEVLRLQCDRSGERTYKLSRDGFECAIQGLFPKEVDLSGITYENFVK